MVGILQARVHGRNPRRLMLATMVLVVVVLLGLGGSVQGGFLASLTNTGNSLAVGTVLLKSGAACDTATQPAFTGLPSANCPSANLLPVTTPGTSPAVSLTADGSLPTTTTGAGATLTAANCGPVRMANTATATDPMLVRGGVGYQAAGPLTNSAGITLDGVAANHSLLSNVSLQSSASLLGASFSAGVWFKVAGGRNGPLLGFGSSPNDTAESTSDNPVMWLDSTGRLKAGVRSTLGSVIATSSAAYTDNAWHFAVMTVTSGVLTISMTIYVDGVQVGSNTVLLSLATGFNGYWHAGWSPVSSAPWSSGTTNYLTGTLADMVVFPSTLTAGQVSSLYSSGSQSTWLSRVSALVPYSSWPLGDDGTTSYTGVLPVVGTTSACSFVDVSIGGSTYCIYPNSIGSACSTPSAKLSNVTGPYAFPPLLSGASTALTSTTVRDPTYATNCASYCPGLHLLLPATVVESYGGLSSALSFTASQTVL